MSDLLVDSGNTRLKWALSDTGVWRTGALFMPARDVGALLDDAWRALPRPARVFVADVADGARGQAMADWVRHRWQLSPIRIQAQSELLGVRSAYREPERLGADRWAALIAARALTNRSACVVDCGTAVTLDALGANGVHAGGVIFPGLTLLRRSLVQGTAALDAAPGNAAHCLARSTADGIAAGTLYGLVGAIERVLDEFEKALGEAPHIYITGGDADQVAAHLARAVQREPDLVLKGLARIAESAS